MEFLFQDAAYNEVGEDILVEENENLDEDFQDDMTTGNDHDHHRHHHDDIVRLQNNRQLSSPPK